MTIEHRTLSPQQSRGKVTLDDVAYINNLERAWEWLRTDMQDGYIKDPIFNVDYICSLEKNLDDLSVRLKQHRYRPRRSTIVEVVKPSYTTRPISVPALEDRLVAWAILAQVGPVLDRKIPDTSMAFRIREPPDKHKFFKSWYREWPNFIRFVRDSVGGEFPYLLRTDIAGYFENIDLARLKEMILLTGEVDDDVIELLFQQLELWVWHFFYSSAGRRGLLQGDDSSPLYANFFLWEIDNWLMDRPDLVYYRFMDDIVILARHEAGAKGALTQLCKALRNKTLTINAAKTFILTENGIEAHFHFTLWDLLENLLDRLKRDGPSQAAKNHARQIYGLILDGPGVGSSHFRRFLTALKRMRDPFLWQDCLGYLVTHPAQTDKIMEYALALPAPMEVYEDLILFLQDPRRNVYPSQEQIIIETLLELDLSGASAMRPFLRFCKHKVHDSKTDYYSACLYALFIYKYGQMPDLRTLSKLFHSGHLTHPLLQKHLALCSTRLSRDRITEARNALIAHVDPDLTRLGLFLHEVTALDSTRPLRKMVRPSTRVFGRVKMVDLDIRHLIVLNLIKLNQHEQNNNELLDQIRSVRRTISYRRTRWLLNETIRDIERHL